MIESNLPKKNGEPIDLRQVLSSELTHDLKAPLATIMGYLNLIEGDIQDRQFDNLLESLDKIERATRTTGNQIDALRKLASIAELDEDLSEISFDELLRESAAAQSLQKDVQNYVDFAIETKNCYTPISLRLAATTFAFEQLFAEFKKWARSISSLSKAKTSADGSDKTQMNLEVSQTNDGPWIQVALHMQLSSVVYAKCGKIVSGPKASLTDNIFRSLMAIHGGRMEGAIRRRPPLDLVLYFPAD